MTAPSKNWTDITDAQVTADAPLDTTLLTEIRDDLVHVKEWLGFGFTAAQAHNHDGVNSAGATVADSAISVAKLKLTQGSWSGNIPAGTNTIVAMNRYGHTPVVGTGNHNLVLWFFEGAGGVSTVGVPLRVVGNNTSGAGQTGVITWDYHAV
jgi:hypothetical protein